MAIFGKQLTMVANAPPEQAVDGMTAHFATADAAPSGSGFNLDNMLRLIPGEILAPYLTAYGLDVHQWASWHLVVFGICLVTCALLRAKASQPVGAPGLRAVNWRLVAVSCVAFVIWAHASATPGPLNDVWPLLAKLPPSVWGFFAVVFGLIAPLFVPLKPTT